MHKVIRYRYIARKGVTIYIKRKHISMDHQDLGLKRLDRLTGVLFDPNFTYAFREQTSTHYELSNHLGNVLTTVTGRKLGIDENMDNVVDYYKPEVVQATDYYPFGAEMPGRTYKNPLFSGTNDYRFGFNGKELDKSGEFGSLTHYDYGFRIYNPSIGKFLSVDPMIAKYPSLSPYTYVTNNPISYVDPDGRDHIFYLVFQKGAKGADEIAAQTQAILNNNKINLKVQVMYTGMDGFGEGYRDKLDGTDRLSFIGNRDFINSVFGGKISFHQGYSDPPNDGYNKEKSVGFVNQSEIVEFAKDIKFLGNLNTVFARTAIHEGIGHPDLGLGHPDGQGGKPERYEGIQIIHSIMDSGNYMDWNDPNSNKFLPVDLEIINKKIPQQNEELIIDGIKCTICRDNATPQDNFSKRIENEK
jgi:RHS repeat-associated protein